MAQPSARQLEYFIAVAESGSFRAAADKLDITQPTITAQIAQLEKHLAVVLFERRRRGAILSPAGRRLLPIARSILEGFDELREVSGVAASGAALFRLGVKSTLGPYVLPQILPGIHTRHNDLRLYVREESPTLLEAHLAAGELDLIMSTYPANDADFTSEPLIREDIHLVLPRDHPLASAEVIEPPDLEGTQILTTEEGHHFTRQIEQTAHRLGAEISRDYQGTSLDALRLMVVMGMGITFLPALYVHSEIRDDTLVVRQIDKMPLARILGISWRSSSPSRLFYRQLVEDMREVLRHEMGHVVRVLDTP